MQQFRFTGPYEALYPSIQDADGRSLTAIPGDVYTFDVPPNDGNWAAVETAVADEFTETKTKKAA